MSLKYDEIATEWKEDEELFEEDFESMMEQKEYEHYDFSRTLNPKMDFLKIKDACQKCIFRQITKYKDTPDVDGTSMGNKFTVPCKGIPRQYISDEVYEMLEIERGSEQGLDLETSRDPVAWARAYLIGENGRVWEPRFYQEVMIACTSKRSVFRSGRRIGKSVALAVFILFYAYVQPFYETDPATMKYVLDDFGNPLQQKMKILCITPRQSHADNLVKKIKGFIDRSPILTDSLKTFSKSPYFKFEFHNGSTIVCLTSGVGTAAEGLNVRSFDADIVVLDEGNYVGEKTMKATNAILMTNIDSMLRISSTPIGIQDFFWEMCFANAKYKDFHYPSVCLPQWDAMKHLIYSDVSTEDEFLHEYMALFSASATGVFRIDLIQQAKSPYSYSSCTKRADRSYAIGVDWNTNAGTEIFVIEVDEANAKYKAVRGVNVPKSEWTQLSAIEELIRQILYWDPKTICVDEGHGNGAIEVIRRYSMEHGKDDPIIWKIREKLRTYNFGSKITVVDPITGEEKKKAAKPFLVENAVRRFEEAEIDISVHDKTLIEQLVNYEIVSVSALGMPIYKPKKQGLGDHRLDAMMLALIGWKLKFGTMDRTHYFVSGSGYIKSAGQTGESVSEGSRIPTRQISSSTHKRASRQIKGVVSTRPIHSERRQRRNA